MTAHSMGSARRRLTWSVAGIAAAAALLSIARAPQCRADTPQVLSFDVELAPVCLDGTFPVVISVPGAPVDGELKISTAIDGKLTGRLNVNGGLGLTLSGSVKHEEGTAKIAFKASTQGAKLTFSGELAPGSRTLAGTCVGKGFLAKGSNPFTIDFTSAAAQMATIECSVTSDFKGRLKGTAHVVSCSADVPLVASGKTVGSTVTLSIKKGKFKFAGSGDSDASGLVLDWTASGFGATTGGAGLVVYGVLPPESVRYPTVSGGFLETDDPIKAIIPTTGNAPRGAFTVSPSLPAGLAIDPTTGVISGTATEVTDSTAYSVTAKNYAGSSTATIRFGTRIPRARSLAPETRFLTDADRRHFLRRAEFGIRQIGGGATNLDRLNTIEINAYVDQMLVFSPSGPAEAIAAPELVNASDPAALKGRFPTAAQIGAWWSSLLMNSDNPFQERLAFFWVDRFAASSDGLAPGETHLMKDYIDLYRFQGNGNLKTLLQQMARSGAMLKFLDGAISTKTLPNENFAREFWELFTLGVDNGYTQADIVEASRAWTGWKLVKDGTTNLVDPVFDPSLHDPTAKTVLGSPIGAQDTHDDFDEVIRITLETRPVAEFISKTLFEQFGHENPSPLLVADMAKLLRDSNYDLTPLLKAILKSEAFFSDKSRSSLVKSPLDYAVGFIHTTGLKITPSNLQQKLAALGQGPGQPPSVNGFPQGVLWLHAQNMTDRAALLAACVDDITRQRSVGIEVASILPPDGQRSTGEVVDRVATLFGISLSASERLRCMQYLDDPTPFDGSSQSVLDDRARGLLFVLAQHPQNEIR